jgi:hypothetical protein
MARFLVKTKNKTADLEDDRKTVSRVGNICGGKTCSEKTTHHWWK